MKSVAALIFFLTLSSQAAFVGIHAAAGNKEAMDTLLEMTRQQSPSENYTLVFALAHRVEAGVAPALQWSAEWLGTQDASAFRGPIMSITNALGKAATNGNIQAQQILAQYQANN